VAPPPIYTLTGCGAPGVKPLFGLAYMFDLIPEAILCFFMLYKAWLTYKLDYTSPLLKVLVRDRFSYLYVYVFWKL